MSCAGGCLKFVVIALSVIYGIIGIIFTAVGGSTIANLKTLSTDLTALQWFPGVIIFLGLLFIFLAIAGVVGAVLRNKCLLISFSTISIILAVFELAIGVGVLITSKQSTVLIYNALKDAFNNSAHQNLFDTIQEYLKCCGVDGPGDYSGSPPSSCCPGNPSVCSSPYSKGCGALICDSFNNVSSGFGAGLIVVAIFQGVIVVCAYLVMSKNSVFE